MIQDRSSAKKKGPAWEKAHRHTRTSIRRWGILKKQKKRNYSGDETKAIGIWRIAESFPTEGEDKKKGGLFGRCVLKLWGRLRGNENTKWDLLNRLNKDVKRDIEG